MHTAALPQISSYFFKIPLANSIYSVSVRSRKVQSFSFVDGGVGDTLRSFPSETAEGWTSVCNSRVKQQALEKLRRKFILSFSFFLLFFGKPGSAFAKVHFCISEHTNPSACSNSLQLSLRQLMTTAQQQHCLISNVFLNLGCQGSLVGGCLLYFSYKKVFFSPQTMTNPKTKKEGALPAIVVKAAVSLL